MHSGEKLCRRLRLMFGLPAGFVVLACLMTIAHTAWAQSDTGLTEYNVQSGDILTVSVWKEEDLQRTVLVRPDGGFSFPLAGEISAVGKSVAQLEMELSARLEQFIPDLIVTVSVEEVLGNRIYVIGQVNNPGTIIMNPQIDVIQALSIAGGTTPFASLNDIQILRRKNGVQSALPFNYADVERGRSLEQNILLETGDVIIVP